MIKNISLKEAQQLTLASQRLAGPTLTPLQIIEHLGYVQIDTLAVVKRAHHHVFWSRNAKYKPTDLDDLVKARKVFEYWSHAASFLPMKDYRYTLPMKLEFRKKGYLPKDTKLMNSVLKRIRTEGPLRSKDFKGTKVNLGWAEGKSTKYALERLFLEGKLEVSHREGFQKVYDLPERVIPSSVDIRMPSEEEYARFLIHRTLRHHGLATAGEISYLRKNDLKKRVEQELQKMKASHEVIQVKVKNLPETYFALSSSLESKPKKTSKVLILSPFDNLVIQRKKLLTLFNFDYQIECYVPEKKRKYGYFCLPVFKGPTPIARIDCKANKKIKKLEVKSVHYEQPRQVQNLNGLESKLKSFAKFNGCDTVSL